MKPGSPKPFFIRAAELLGQMNIDRRKVDSDYIRPPWYTDDGKSMDWSLCKMRKRTPNEIFQAEFQELVKNTTTTQESTPMGQRRKKSRIRGSIRSSVFSRNQEDIMNAIQKLPTTGVRKVRFTD
jgi:hypothetical protein